MHYCQKNVVCIVHISPAQSDESRDMNLVKLRLYASLIDLYLKKLSSYLCWLLENVNFIVAQSARAVKYTDCIFAEG